MFLSDMENIATKDTSKHLQTLIFIITIIIIIIIIRELAVIGESAWNLIMHHNGYKMNARHRFIILKDLR
jgi:hypothetical protein